ncbi:MAG TPA: hypothetical protein VL651_01245 [Bacteroidia bacterium]|jgi:hypothetical protein|nr:hypothetical protein [Bacteroidia bacterium]
MLIRFGIRSTSSKLFRPEELGLQNNPQDPYEIEVRAKYFHILYIPFFPVSKIAVIRKRDGKLYEIAAAYAKVGQMAIQQSSSPWYTYLGCILIPAMLLIVLFANMMH